MLNPPPRVPKTAEMSFQAASLPANEAERVGALHDLAILDTLPEQVYDDLVLLAAGICETPVALISLVDAGRQWFKSKLGLAASETPRDVAFCSHAILEPEQVFSVPDARRDPRFAENPLVTGGPGVCAYAGAPIVMASGDVLGTLCVIDTVPRTLTAAQHASLQALARQAAGHLELRKLNQTLEATVAQRTRELAGALEEARAASLAKSTFVATMSHEIRTPLNGVLGMLELLGSTPMIDEQRTLLAAADRSAKALLGIASQVLELSKLGAGAVVLTAEPFQLGDMVGEACRMLTDDLRNAGVRIESRHGQLPRVLGDEGRLRQVLINLLGNAIKFTQGIGRPRRVAVAVVSVPELSRPGQVGFEISVQDNGIGMADETIANLFKPFVQGDTSISRRFGGSGLGLAISADLTRLMGGSLHAESTLGTGSVFTLRMALTQAPALPPLGCEHGPALLAPAAARPERILVAEDNEINREVISRQLGLLGFRCELADDGDQALGLWRRGGYDLLLTDLQMPVMDGYGLAVGIRREEPPGRRMPIVALTATVIDELVADCRSAGIDDVLAKPAPLRSLEAALQRWLQPAASPSTACANRSTSLSSL